MNVPQWLENDIKTLALKDARLSCVIYELYNKYANRSLSGLDVDERLKFLTMANERLDYIDNNIEIIKYAITNY